MGAACPVLLLAEGDELDDVASVLRGLGAAFELRKGASAAGPVPLPRDLLVATARRALALPAPPRGPAELRGAARVAIVDSDSPGLRAGLREAGFDLLVRRPVHPTALRLLLLRLLYRGPERRRETRVSVGASTRYRSGLLWRRAVLTELSVGGCRLLTPRPVALGWRIGVEIPDAPGSPLRLSGRVVRSNGVGPADTSFTLAVEFLKVTPGARERLARIVASHEQGPAPLSDGWTLEEASPAARDQAGDAEPTAIEPSYEGEASFAQEASSDSETSPEAKAASGDGASPEAAEEGIAGERRRSARPAYTMRVVTLGEEAARVVMGRDLSAGGIRIEPHGGLERGQRLALALHGAGLAVPLVVRGAVIRDDGDAGLVIRFDTLSASQSEALAKILAGLDGIEAIGPRAEVSPQLVTRIL